MFAFSIRMLSTAQKPGDAKHRKRDEEVIDEWGQPKVRRPPSIDVATVVGITVGAFLFILIGTGKIILMVELYSTKGKLLFACFIFCLLPTAICSRRIAISSEIA
jgi:hypothetical protein